MRLALVFLCACTAADPVPLAAGGRRVDAATGPGARAAACYEGRTPADVSEALRAELERDGWSGVRVLPHPVLARVNVVARRGADALSAVVEPGCGGSLATVGVIRSRGADTDVVGPGGPGRARVSGGR